MKLRDLAIIRPRATINLSKKNSVDCFDGYSFEVCFYDHPDFDSSMERILEYYKSFIGSTVGIQDYSVRGPYIDNGDPCYIIFNNVAILRVIGSPNCTIKDSFLLEDVFMGEEAFVRFKEHIKEQLNLEKVVEETEDEA